MKILVINAGSSSLKYQLIDMDKSEVMAKGLCERIGIGESKLNHTPNGCDKVVIEKDMKDHADAIKMVLDALTDANHGVISSMDEISAVGHRVVHGGEKFNKSAIIDSEVKAALEECIPLAPLHNPANIIGIEACEKAMPGVPQVGVFDTAFHQTMPKEAYMYGIPYDMYEKHKIRRYGFHGTSHKFVSQQAALMLNKPAEELKIITFHLGNGSSITAVDGGKSIDTSMGFTPLAGVVMGTRCGDIDPAIVKFIADAEDVDLKEVDNILNKKSGVDGISGVSSDFRDLEAAAKDGNEKAQLALDMFVYSVRKFLGQYIVAMGGVDAIVFTAGIGENTVMIRDMILKNTEFLGIEMDKAKNEKAIRGAQMDIATDASKVRVLVIPTNEELMIAKETQELLK
ncbi:MAG: acetate kinase [Ruminococcaceae bacterium]|nr:acetate kinase [Oscillospiraceae bacterium]